MNLKPCPICGTTNNKPIIGWKRGVNAINTMTPDPAIHIVDHFIQCTGCGVTISGRNSPEAVADLWNKKGYGND